MPYIASELDIKESLVELMKHINDLHERLGNMIRSKLLWILWLCLELFGVAMAILLDDWPHLIPILAIAVMIHLSHAIYWNYMSRRTETKRRILIEEFNEKCNYNFPAHFIIHKNSLGSNFEKKICSSMYCHSLPKFLIHRLVVTLTKICQNLKQWKFLCWLIFS